MNFYDSNLMGYPVAPRVPETWMPRSINAQWNRNGIPIEPNSPDAEICRMDVRRGHSRL
jgi:hypothetical protein